MTYHFQLFSKNWIFVNGGFTVDKIIILKSKQRVMFFTLLLSFTFLPPSGLISLWKAWSLSEILRHNVVLSSQCHDKSHSLFFFPCLLLIFNMFPNPAKGYKLPVAFLAIAQAGNSVRLNRGTPHVVMASMTTATPIRFTPKPAFTWRRWRAKAN